MTPNQKRQLASFNSLLENIWRHPGIISDQGYKELEKTAETINFILKRKNEHPEDCHVPSVINGNFPVKFIQS